MRIYRRRERVMRTNPLISGCILLGIGSIFALVGFFLVVSTLVFLPGAVAANGTIVRCDYVQDRDGSTSCQPEVSFKTQTGQTVTFASSGSSDTYHAGDSVAVKYHLANPHDARIDTFLETWLFPLVFGGSGVLMVLLGLFIWLGALLRRA